MSLKDFVRIQGLGRGSFAVVQKCRRLVDNQIYAIKEISLTKLCLKQKNNALNQIRLLASLSSPYIIPYYQSFYQQHLDLLCIVMQYADGGDLSSMITKFKKEKKLIGQVEIWKVAIYLLYGLRDLHQRRVLHRDLKADNVFRVNQSYKIGDMNVSKIIKNDMASTQTGTPYYASPEVWNDQPYDQKSDIWSLGCILYQLAALRPPFQANNMEKLFQYITKAQAPKIPKIYSKQLQGLINSCLQKQSKNRPSAKQLLQNFTLKMYQNILIDFKPQTNSCIQQNLMKTIYMPKSKKQINNQLPQSNYKHNSQIKSIKSNQLSSINKQLEYRQQIKQIQPLTNTKQEQLKLKQNKNNKNNTSNTNNTNNVNNINSKKQEIIRLIQNTNKQSFSPISLNKPLRERIHSCKIFKSNIINKINNKQNLFSRADFIIQSQKKSKINDQGSTSKKKHKLCQVLKQIKPKRLNFNQNAINQQKLTKDRRQNLYVNKQNIQGKKQNIQDKKQNIQGKKQNIQGKKQNIQGKKQNLQTKKQTNLQRQTFKHQISIDNISPCKILSDININNQSIYRLSKNCYLHQNQYKQLDHNQPKYDKQIKLQTPQKDKFMYINLQNQYRDMNQLKANIDKSRLDYSIGIQKVQNVIFRSTFKFKFRFFNQLINLDQKFKVQKEQNDNKVLKYQQSSKNIYLNIKDQIKLQVKQVLNQKSSELKRLRSKSMPKTQKLKKKHQQQKSHQNSIQSNNKIYEKTQNKINEKTQNKINEKTQNKIYEKTYNKMKQLSLIPNVKNINNKEAGQKQINSDKKDMNQKRKIFNFNDQIQKKLVINQKSNLKKPRIFHQLSGKLDRKQLQNKIKKYINVY